MKIFKALADETRLRIYLLLLKQELYVCEIVNILKIEQSRVSHCLRILKEAHLVTYRKEGTWIVYSANPKMSHNKIIEGLKKEIPIPSQDLINLHKCLKEKIRMKCKTKTGSMGYKADEFA